MSSAACKESAKEPTRPDSPPPGAGAAAPDETETEPPTAEDPRLVAAPPPDGVILPTIGRLRSAEIGPRSAAYQWRAFYEVDPDDPALVEYRKQDRGTANLTVDSLAVSYLEEQFKKDNIEVTNYGPSFAYPIQEGTLTVFVAADDSRYPDIEDEPLVFQISVGPTGG